MRKILIFIVVLFIISDAKIADASSLLSTLNTNLSNKFHHGILPYRLNEKEQQLAKFYEKNNFKPQWVTSTGPTIAVSAILETVKKADNEGLEPKDYLKKISKIEKLTNPPYSIESLNELEILVSELAMDYIDDLFGERLTPKKISPLLYINPSSIDASDILYKGNNNDPSGEWFKKLTINRPDYQFLKKMLEYYRSLQMLNNWAIINSPKSFKEFQKNPSLVAQLQTNLKQHKIYQGTVNGHFDTETENALLAFQKIYGQETDGILGSETLKALNTPPEERIKQIIVTMERWRWFPHDIGEQYLIVNIAGFILVGYKDHKETLRMPIIIGQKLRKTPVFSSTIFEIRFNPTWYVPHSIAVKDKLPLLRRDPASMIKKGYTIRDHNGNSVDPLQINWSQVDAEEFPFSLTQAPGSLNALGRIFFNIQSPFGIFLHDTPDTALFSKAKRNFSSGCIRVSKPIELALFILQNNGHINSDLIQEKINSNKTTNIHLSFPIPVHITYLTVWFDKEGNYHFYDDIYGLDQTIWEALQRRTQTLLR